MATDFDSDELETGLNLENPDTPKRRGRKPKEKHLDNVPAQATVSAQDGHEIRFQKDIRFRHDLYKLELSQFLKNVAMDGDAPDYVKTEHVHYFHTVDSNGKTQAHCSSVGGHFHKMRVIQGSPGRAPQVICDSGPVRMVKKKNQYGKWVKVEAPVNDVDHHVHDVIYLKSDELKPRANNSEALRVATVIEQRTAPVPGVEVK